MSGKLIIEGNAVYELDEECMLRKRLDQTDEEEKIDQAARSLGSDLPNPMMYMFFLPITAIPDYAITDVGPVDYVNLTTFEPVLAVREK